MDFAAKLEYAILLKKSFKRFVEGCWDVVDPKPFRKTWDICAICDHLQAVHDGEINRLIITIPPGRAKSLTNAVFYPAWVWLSDPAHRFLTGTCRDDLTIRDTLRSRDLIRSYFYQTGLLQTLEGSSAFKIKDDQDQKHKYFNDKLGWRVAFSTQGGITGDRGDTIILDDPLDIKKIDVKLHCDRLITWMQSGMMTRLDGWETGKGNIIVIMQRLGTRDPVNFLLKQDGWTHLKIPMEYKADKTIITPYFHDRRTEKNELLEGLTPEIAEKKKKDIGIYNWETQYNQEPIKIEGNLIRTSKFKTYNPEDNHKFYLKLQSWDTAFKTGQMNDYSVGIDFGVKIENDQLLIYIRNIYRKRIETPELKRDIRVLKKLYMPDVIIMEDKASGQTIIPELQRYDGSNEPIFIKPIKVTTDKVSRAHSISPIVDSGIVYVPEYADWLPDFISECESFPTGDHDDQVDAFTQGIIEIINDTGITQRGMYE